jgi:hypothetical protein
MSIDAMPGCYGHEQRKARKTHKCCECDGIIQVGEPYHYHHGIWDGEASDFKVCLDCEVLRHEYDADSHPDECTAFGELSETVAGCGAHEKELFVRFVEIKRKRGASVSDWMAEDAVAYATKGPTP